MVIITEVVIIINEKDFWVVYWGCLLPFPDQVRDIVSTIHMIHITPITAIIQIKGMVKEGIKVHGHDTFLEKKDVSTRLFAWWI